MAVFWLALTIILLIVEALTFNLTTIWFALASLIMIFVSRFPIPLQWQILIFVLLSLLILFSTRSVVAKIKTCRSPTNVDALIGKSALLTEGISKFQKGALKINGITWAAESDSQEEIPAGEECIIKEVRGATLVVSRAQSVKSEN